MGYSDDSNGSDLSIVTVVLQYNGHCKPHYGQRGLFNTNCEFGQLPTPPATTSHPSCPNLFNSASSFLLLVVPTTLYCHLVMQSDRGTGL